MDYETFSMTVQAIPPDLSPNLPMELDPPEHAPIRNIVNPMFALPWCGGLKEWCALPRSN